MSFIKIWLCLIGVHIPIKTNKTHSMHRATCACGTKHWRWFER